ncbi:MAG: TlpA disulfide reductase family protein [Gemmatimonadota bacterium]|nr:TlpA disulfide reductase family protein [Gemmatimonadota bacterium]
MKSLKSAITIIATVATAFSCGIASAESITVKMESVREDSVEHLFKPPLYIYWGAQLTEGLPEIQSVTGLEIHEPLHARLSFRDSPAAPIVLVGLDNDGQDIAFVIADSTAQPQRLQLARGFFKRLPSQDEVLRAELTVPPVGQAPEFKIELYIERIENSRWDYVHHRNLELRLGEAEIGGQRYAVALIRDPSFGTYSLPDDSLSVDSSDFPNHKFLIDRNGNGTFLVLPSGRQTGDLEDEIFGVKEPFLINDQLYKLADVSATGDRLVIERSHQEMALAVGFEMPNVTVTRLDGSTIDLTALRGKPVVINWWHTACSPCIAETPELNKLVEKYEGRDVEFLAIANNEMAELPPFLKKHPFSYDIVLGNGEAMRVLGQAYPRHVIVNSRGKVVLDLGGGSSGIIGQIDAVISSLLVSEL